MAKKKFINETHIEGIVYDHALELKVSGETSANPGTEFITGTINIATDDAMVNIVPVHFTYVTELTKSGTSNATYKILRNLVDNVYKTHMSAKDGETPAKVRIDSAIGLNEFYSDKSGKEELISAKRNEGGFVHLCDALNEDENKRNTFKCDMLITSTIHIEPDEEKGTSEKVVVKGYTFDFRNNILPIEFSAVHPGAMEYFDGLDASSSNPTFTTIWGNQISEVIVRTIEEESAFGLPSVREVRSSRKDFVINGASKVPYEWDTEETLTVADIKEFMAVRETNLAAMKKRQAEYKASKNQGFANIAAAPTSKKSNNDEFNF